MGVPNNRERRSIRRESDPTHPAPHVHECVEVTQGQNRIPARPHLSVRFSRFPVLRGEGSFSSALCLSRIATRSRERERARGEIGDRREIFKTHRARGGKGDFLKFKWVLPPFLRRTILEIPMPASRHGVDSAIIIWSAKNSPKPITPTHERSISGKLRRLAAQLIPISIWECSAWLRGTGNPPFDSWREALQSPGVNQSVSRS